MKKKPRMATTTRRSGNRRAPPLHIPRFCLPSTSVATVARPSAATPPIVHPAVAAWFSWTFSPPTAAQRRIQPLRAGGACARGRPDWIRKDICGLPGGNRPTHQGGGLNANRSSFIFSPLKALSNDIQRVSTRSQGHSRRAAVGSPSVAPAPMQAFERRPSAPACGISRPTSAGHAGIAVYIAWLRHRATRTQAYHGDVDEIHAIAKPAQRLLCYRSVAYRHDRPRIDADRTARRQNH